ncbi:hypothetical protein DSM3645_07206 [Blastopirellula marina DSM 3645]|uniref:Uncharacterized protein n=1 Tax=Blastopirellula marina DSM 3645 TaxID=314230 RepID=A3ZYL9_9BACT|nr:hypothetical protein DSM3645_07206 [Blastopirellula marina DSM 3645]
MLVKNDFDLLNHARAQGPRQRVTPERKKETRFVSTTNRVFRVLSFLFVARWANKANAVGYFEPYWNRRATFPRSGIGLRSEMGACDRK